MIFFAKGIYSQLIFNDLLNTTRDAELLLQSENFLNSIASPSKRSSFGKFVLQFNSFPINSIMREIIYNTHTSDMSGKDFMSWIVQLKMQLKICSVWFSYQFWFYIKCTVFIHICLLSKYGGKIASSFNHPSVWTNYSNCNITRSEFKL